MSPPTAEEVASSNNTLNALMGRRRKSWMTSASSGGIIRPSPRVQEPQPSQEYVFFVCHQLCLNLVSSKKVS